jgi:hypothetical protein
MFERLARRSTRSHEKGLSDAAVHAVVDADLILIEDLIAR